MIKLELDHRELTHIRVAMLTRLTKLKDNPDFAISSDLQKSYAECRAMMDTGGKLYVAMRQAQSERPPDAT